MEGQHSQEDKRQKPLCLNNFSLSVLVLSRKTKFYEILLTLKTLTAKAQVNNRSLVSNQNMCCHVILSGITSHIFLPADILIKHASVFLRSAEFKNVPTIITHNTEKPAKKSTGLDHRGLEPNFSIVTWK